MTAIQDRRSEMRSAQVTADGFTILSDAGDMLAGVTVTERKEIDIAPVGAYSGFDLLPILTPELQSFAEAEARRLGMLDG